MPTYVCVVKAGLLEALPPELQQYLSSIRMQNERNTN